MIIALFLGLFAPSLAFAQAPQGLTDVQIQAIIMLLTSFGVDKDTLYTVSMELNKNVPVAKTAALKAKVVKLEKPIDTSKAYKGRRVSSPNAGPQDGPSSHQ